MTTMVIRAAIAEPTTVIVGVARLIRARLLIICMPLDPSCRSLSTHVEDCPLLVATPSARVTFTCREGEQIVTFCCRSSGGSLGVPQTPKAGRGERLAAGRTHGLRDCEVGAFIGEGDAMRYDLVVRSRQAVLPGGTRPASVAVSGPVITAVGEYGARYDADRDVDLGDLALLPGLVDSHVHVNEPGRTEWEGFATATRAAAAGGVTTVCDMPLNSLPPTVSVAALADKRAAAAGKCWVDVAFWGGAVPGNEAELLPMHEAGVIGF